jgi:hypothetical protein
MQYLIVEHIIASNSTYICYPNTILETPVRLVQVVDLRKQAT